MSVDGRKSVNGSSSSMKIVIDMSKVSEMAQWIDKSSQDGKVLIDDGSRVSSFSSRSKLVYQYLATKRYQ
jgi:hypothetical protein